MRTVAALAVVVALGACSDSTDRDAEGGWKKGTLADGRLSFEMPGPALHSSGETKQMPPDRIESESATCIDDACHYTVSVSEGEALAKRMGTTEKQRLRWANFDLLRIMQQDEERSIEDDGQWNQGKLVGRWIQLALPAKPPEQTVPVYKWVYVAAWEGQAVYVKFIATQAAYDDEIRGPAVEQARERFVTSVTVE